MGTISHTVTTWDTLGREEKGVPIALDYRQAAQEILDAIGGRGNVVSAAHCATRLRPVLADDAKVDQAAVDNAAGAKGNFKASGQLQVIYGTGTVNKVYDEFIALGHISAATKAEAKEAAQQQTNPLMRAIKLLGDVFVPIIPAIVASGLLLGIMSALSFMDANDFITLQTDNAWYQILNLVSNTAFTFLQILIGFSAAKAFGANPYLGAVIGMLLINPALQNANTVATEGVQQTYAVIPGLYSIEWTGYQGHVIPIVIACAILAFVEKRLHKVVPEAFDLFVTPLVSVAVTAYITMLVVGPIFVWAENAILGGIQWLITLPAGIGSLIMGALYAPTVVTGIHQMYTTIDLGQIAQYGVTYWLPLASAANIGQDGTVRLTFADDRVGCGRDERAASVDAVRDLRVLVDSSAVEVFVNGGELALATRWFPRSERLTLVQRGQALLHIWEMGDGMAGTY